MPRLSLHQKLAVLALFLGIVALFGHPRPASVATIDTGELARLVARTEDHVTPAELAGWILEGRADYRLIDLRGAADFAAYHIPGAENLPLASLLDGSLARNEKILLYSEGGTHGAQAWLLLRASGYRAAYNLLGGLEGWKDEVLYPVAPAEGSPEAAAQFARAAEIARHFGGAPRAGGLADAAAAAVAAPELPAPVPPSAAAPAAPAGAAKKAKRKEGC